MPPEEKQPDEPKPQEAAAGPPPAEESEPYPVRDPKEDPRWAIVTVKIWVWFALASLAFVLALIVLGFIYD